MGDAELISALERVRDKMKACAIESERQGLVMWGQNKETARTAFTTGACFVALATFADSLVIELAPTHSDKGGE